MRHKEERRFLTEDNSTKRLTGTDTESELCDPNSPNGNELSSLKKRISLRNLRVSSCEEFETANDFLGPSPLPAL
jgi:hypothetical protein